jgi:hypothetical protein
MVTLWQGKSVKTIMLLRCLVLVITLASITPTNITNHIHQFR